MALADEGWTSAWRNVIVWIALALFDATASSKNARWFSVHAFGNLLVVLSSLHSVFTVIGDPFHAMDITKYNDNSFFGDASIWPAAIINSLHIYHLVAPGFKLTSADYFHHLMFIPTVGFLGQYYQWACIGNFLCFFMSGFPGGTDYCLLTLCKDGKFDKLQQKRISSALNAWCRGPGIVTASLLGYIGVLYGKNTAPAWAAALLFVLCIYNGQYYAKQAIANFAVHHVLAALGQDQVIQQRIKAIHLKQRTSKVSGMPVMDFTTPQRCS